MCNDHLYLFSKLQRTFFSVQELNCTIKENCIAFNTKRVNQNVLSLLIIVFLKFFVNNGVEFH